MQQGWWQRLGTGWPAGVMLCTLMWGAGEALARLGGLLLPGAILGLLLLLLLLALVPRAALPVREAAARLIPLLGLFVLPLAVQTVQLLGGMAPATLMKLLVMLLAATLVTGVVTALLLALLARRA